MNEAAARGVKRARYWLGGRAKWDAVYLGDIASHRPQPHMAVANLGDIDKAVRRQDENRFGIARAIGASSRQASHQARIGAGRGKRRVDQQSFPRAGGSDRRGEAFFEETPKVAQPLPRDSNPGRHRMAAALDENPGFGRRAHHAAKIDSGNRAAGPSARPARIESDRKGGTPDPLLKARGDKPGYARMPAVARRDDHGGAFHGEASQRLRLGFVERGAL